MIKTKSLSRNAPIHLFLIVSSLMLILVPYLNKAPSFNISEKTVHAAAQFLYLVDQEEYAKSWEVSSATLQEMLPQTEWNEKIAQLRAMVGPLVERFQHQIAYADEVVGGPSARYVVVTFISKFQLRERAKETITLLLDENNDQWLVAGYFLN